MSARAGIVVTGTEVLGAQIADRNGPWLSERLRELGVDLQAIVVVGDRPIDIEAALRWLAAEGVDLTITTGGLGPTADDITVAVVARAQGRPLALDEPLRQRIAHAVEGAVRRWPRLDRDALDQATRKQATVPKGATILEPVGTAPGLVVPPADGVRGPTVLVLPGPPRELQPMWAAALATDALRGAVRERTTYRQEILRLYGIPESEIAETLRLAERAGVQLAQLEVTTCMRSAELEIVARFEPVATPVYEALASFVRERHGGVLYSDDGSTVDEQVARLLTRRPARTVATAESCTGGLLAARLTELPGASAYVRGAIVAYSNEAKTSLAGVEPELLARHGAVSVEVARALADGAIERLDADLGIGVTGVAGPGGGSHEKPVGLVWISVAGRGGAGRIDRSVHLPGARADVRERATTVALHMLRRMLLGPGDDATA